jgi:hypothetical protein
MKFTPFVTGPSEVPHLDELPAGERTAVAALFSAAFSRHDGGGP